MIKKIIGAAITAAMFVCLAGCGIPETPKQPKTKEGLESTALAMAEYTQKGEYKKFIEGTIWPLSPEAKEAKAEELKKMGYVAEVIKNSGEIGFGGRVGGRDEVGTTKIKIKMDEKEVAGTWFFEYHEKKGWRLGS